MKERQRRKIKQEIIKKTGEEKRMKNKWQKWIEERRN